MPADALLNAFFGGNGGNQNRKLRRSTPVNFCFPASSAERTAFIVNLKADHYFDWCLFKNALQCIFFRECLPPEIQNKGRPSLWWSSRSSLSERESVGLIWFYVRVHHFCIFSALWKNFLFENGRHPSLPTLGAQIYYCINPQRTKKVIAVIQLISLFPKVQKPTEMKCISRFSKALFNFQRTSKDASSSSQYKTEIEDFASFLFHSSSWLLQCNSGCRKLQNERNDTAEFGKILSTLRRERGNKVGKNCNENACIDEARSQKVA